MKTFIDFKSEIQSGKVRNVYYVAALDNYFVSKAGDILREKLSGSIENKDNFFLLYADESSIQEIIDLSANFTSLFSSQKIIIVKRCEKFSRKLNDLLDFYKKPPTDAFTLLVFDLDYVIDKKLDKELDFYDFTELPQKELKEWVRTEFEKHGLKIENEVNDFFISSVPGSFDLLTSEIEKISNYDFESTDKIVTKDLILRSTGYDTEYSPDELVHSIIIKDHNRSLKILDNLINSSGLNEIYLLSILSSYYMDLISFKTKGFENGDSNALYGKYKMWGERAKFAKNYHKSLNLNSLQTAFKVILETDQKLKTSMLDSKILMTSLVEELINA